MKTIKEVKMKTFKELMNEALKRRGEKDVQYVKEMYQFKADGDSYATNLNPGIKNNTSLLKEAISKYWNIPEEEFEIELEKYNGKVKGFFIL